VKEAAMNATMNTPRVGPKLTLWATTAADLMMPDPVSVREDATVHEALTLLLDRGYSAAPVINEAGHPVGVLSRSDLLVHDRERIEHVPPMPEFYHRSELQLGSGERLPRGFQVEKVERTLVRDLMTPAVFSVAPDAPAGKVIDEMLGLKVHRLFVVDRAGVLVGVISAFDVLRHLKAVS